MARIVLLLIGVLTIGVSHVWAEEDALSVVLVQYAVDARDYATLDRFSDRVEDVVAQAVRRHGADVVVFPEYVSTFALFSPMIDTDGGLLRDALPPRVRALVAAGPGRADADDAGNAREDTASFSNHTDNLDDFHRLVRQQAERRGTRVRTVWQDAAREYDVWIVAGSGFVPAVNRGVYNRVWVVAPDGRITYRQDKVFLTRYERTILGVVPGRVDEAHPVAIDGVRFGVTICRDSYFDEWEPVLGAADVWLDVRANGEVWTEDVRRRFDTALPERVAHTEVPLGFSTSLNGSFLSLVWQGPSFVVDSRGKRIRQSPVVDGNHLLAVSVPR